VLTWAFPASGKFSPGPKSVLARSHGVVLDRRRRNHCATMSSTTRVGFDWRGRLPPKEIVQGRTRGQHCCRSSFQHSTAMQKEIPCLSNCVDHVFTAPLLNLVELASKLATIVIRRDSSARHFQIGIYPCSSALEVWSISPNQPPPPPRFWGSRPQTFSSIPVCLCTP
jgi:hypothetical protein